MLTSIIYFQSYNHDSNSGDESEGEDEESDIDDGASDHCDDESQLDSSGSEFRQDFEDTPFAGGTSSSYPGTYHRERRKSPPAPGPGVNPFATGVGAGALPFPGMPLLQNFGAAAANIVAGIPNLNALSQDPEDLTPSCAFVVDMAPETAHVGQ
ncbi:hypothetical protein MVEN_00927900 [Mycena venus]|uniref:Uncharacterized protein n=1 Tax=Mycena venus TaxID=2733690 RepID=A0A8H6YDE3_9AGAR|nr:hypothetical protein MVEN_00927900 [Mycena venus]